MTQLYIIAKHRIEQLKGDLQQHKANARMHREDADLEDAAADYIHSEIKNIEADLECFLSAREQRE